MTTRLRLEDVRRAWESSDPELGRLVVQLAVQPDEKPETPPREGAPTFARFLAELHSPAFAKKPPEEQKHFRIEQLKALESPTAEVPLPDRLRLHESHRWPCGKTTARSPGRACWTSSPGSRCDMARGGR